MSVTSIAVVRARAREHMLRYRLLVMTPTAAQAVCEAGGWLFDRVMAGWDVTVLTATAADPGAIPIRILGADVIRLADFVRGQQPGPPPQGIAVIGDVCRSSEPARRMVADRLDAGDCEITVGGRGDVWPDRVADTIDYRPSAAAQVFKRHALAQSTHMCEAPLDRESLRHTGTAVPTVLPPQRIRRARMR
ncbi:hypothetical protein [Nocardia aurantia]|uniref:Uncharacterized protein n=1 Tax=Nocardia aurantia TaxID=2585199 RepID=A0A7K0E1A3_9NOCA|nr:hypothetical protein [Nocardia aurantia]MQY31568.1 hypothetical protein [Nocardia aurantia]